MNPTLGGLRTSNKKLKYLYKLAKTRLASIATMAEALDYLLEKERGTTDISTFRSGLEAIKLLAQPWAKEEECHTQLRKALGKQQEA